MSLARNNAVPTGNPSAILAGMAGCLLTWSAAAQTDSAEDSSQSSTESQERTTAGSGEGDQESLDEFESLDESLDLLLEDFDVVVSASRTAQSASLASAAVSTLSSEFLHYSGARNIQDVFEFALGTDVLRLDRNRWAIGVRGLHQTFSDRTLFLQNGRNISDPIYGGIDFQRQPIFVENIERIEFLRGPGSGAWGANAFNGVVNVIEKSPRDTAGVLSQYSINEYGDQQAFLRLGESTDTLSWRVSAQFNEVESSDDAIDGGVFQSNDWSRSRLLSFDGVYDFDTESSFEFGGGYAHLERGSSGDFASTFNDVRVDRGNAYAKLNHVLEDGSSLSLQWYGAYQDESSPGAWRADTADTTFDGQYTFQPADDHEMTIGATARYVHIEISDAVNGALLEDQTAAEAWLGGFISNRWQVTDQWIVEGQARYDWYSSTEGDFAGRLTVLRLLDPEGDHVLRFGAARSFRTPQLGIRGFTLQAQPIEAPGLPPDLFALNFETSTELDNEQLYSLELGYSGRLTERITLDADAYYMRYYDLTGIENLPEPQPQIGRRFARFTNVGGAVGWGFETELTYRDEQNSIALWYGMNHLTVDEQITNARSFGPARNKFGVRARTSLTEAVTASANYRFTDTTPAVTEFGIPDIRDSHRLDLTLAWSDPSSTFEILLGVEDVFDSTDTPIVPQTSPLSTPLETPGRTFFVRAQIEF